MKNQWSLVLAVCTLASCLAHADSIRGMVLDSSGAAIAGARVEATHGRERVTSKTSGDGSFSLDANPPADKDWTLRVSAPGFSATTITVSPPFASPVTVRLGVANENEEIAVTARRTDAALSETAESVTVFNSERLAQASAFTLDNQLRQSPGFNLFRRSDSLTANPTSQGVSFRGIGASGASRTLVLSDGAPLNDPFGGWVYWDRIPRAEVQRVEVLQGGASQLYGSTALSGVVDVVTRRPSGEWLVIETSGGTRSTPEGSAYAGKDFGGWSLFGSGGGYSTNGFVPTPASLRGTVDTAAASRDANGMLSLVRDYGSGSLRFDGLFFHESRDNGTPLQTNATDIGEGRASWTQNIGGGALHANFFGSGQSYDQSFSSVAADRNSEALTRLQHVPAQRLGGGLQWTSASDHKQQWTFGTDMQSVHGSSLERGFAAGTPTVITSAGGTQRTFGFFGQDTLRLNSRVILNAGARIDRWTNTDAASISQSVATGVVTTTPFSDRDENFFSPRASLLVRLTDGWALTFSGTRAFRAPTLNELYRSFRLGNVVTNANNALTAEQLYGGEGGLMANVKRLTLRAVGFVYVVQDPVANVTLSSTPALIMRQRQNLGETQSRGVELSAGIQVLPYWTLQGGYQFTHALVQDFPADPTLIGLRIPQVPAHAFTFQSVWQSHDWTLAAQGRATGNQFDDDQNAFPLGRAFTLDAMLQKHFSSGVTLFVAGQNLTNDRYLTARTPTPQEAAGIGGRVGIRIELPSR